jgi:photosystem II stability/assembly factor-like uncharacterized protein
MKIYALIILCVMQINLIAQNDSVFVQRDPGKIFLSSDLGDTWSRSDNGFPEQAIINALTLADNVVVAATEEHGIYLSADGLKSWAPSSKGLPSRAKVNSLIFHQGLLFAGTYQHGVFSSADKGRTWKSTNAGVANEPIRCFYSLGNTLLAGADQGIYRSEDNGKSWAVVFHGNQINSFTAKNNILYAATNRGILRSVNTVEWATVWNLNTVISIAQNDNELIAMSDGPVYLAAGNDGKHWITLHPFFDRYTFRLTPSSDRLFIAPYKKTLRALNENEYFHGRGLPEKTPFSFLLETPYGVVVAIGFTGC